MPILTTRGAGSASGFGFGGGANAFIGTFTISSNTYNYDMRSAAISGGWDGTSDANITVNISPGIYVGSTSTGSSAFNWSRMAMSQTGQYIIISAIGYGV